MKITVLGTGMVGRAMAEKLLSLGHQVAMGTRDPEKTKAFQKDNFSFQDWLSANPVNLTTFVDAAAQAETMVINCTAGMISMDALNMAGTANLKGKVLLDIANPLDFSKGQPPFLNPGNTDSLGEQIQAAFPETHVVKSLNTMNCYLMVNPALIAGEHNVFVSGNDEAAKEQVKTLLNSFGWNRDNILDLGDITGARATEQLLPIWLKLWAAKGTPMFNFGVVMG